MLRLPFPVQLRGGQRGPRTRRDQQNNRNGPADVVAGLDDRRIVLVHELDVFGVHLAGYRAGPRVVGAPVGELLVQDAPAV